MEKIVYKCKKCRWQVSIPALWEDLKPAVCGNKKCKTSFKKAPEDLIEELPGTKAAVSSPKVEKVLAVENKQEKEFRKLQQPAVKKEDSEPKEQK
jgi:hypothetical protein